MESKELAGISLIRSLGPSEYVRDFMAYSLMHRILPLDEECYLCDRIFAALRELHEAYVRRLIASLGKPKRHCRFSEGQAQTMGFQRVRHKR